MGNSVPKNNQHVIYVWLDAHKLFKCIGFCGTEDKKYKKFWPADLHVIGKDILRFHAIYWPAFLMAAKLPFPKESWARVDTFG